MTKHTKAMAAHITNLANDLRSTVADIESGIKTTQNHYGQYMSILSMANNARGQTLLAHALCEAGGNRQGIADALRAVT